MNTSWLDTKAYPFKTKTFRTAEGNMSYIDEGQGEILLMVHGTPAWSFLYRHLVKDLSKDYRCIAPDLLGFGLSDKPEGADYTPQGHSRRLGEFIAGLGLTDITLIMQDFGGPIGMGYAVNHPDNVKRIVVSNSWMWSLKGIKNMETAAKLDNWLGRFLYLTYGFSAKFMIPQSFADKKKLSKETHRQYLEPLSTPKERIGTFAFLQSLMGSTNWYESIWNKRSVLSGKPVLIMWGMKDKFIPADPLLGKWQEAFPQAKVIKLEKAGHFIEEEVPAETAEAVCSFLG